MTQAEMLTARKYFKVLLTLRLVIVTGDQINHCHSEQKKD